MSEPVNGGPASNEAAGPSPAAHTEPMDTTTDEPRAEVCPQLSLFVPLCLHSAQANYISPDAT